MPQGQEGGKEVLLCGGGGGGGGVGGGLTGGPSEHCGGCRDTELRMRGVREGGEARRREGVGECL